MLICLSSVINPNAGGVWGAAAQQCGCISTPTGLQSHGQHTVLFPRRMSPTNSGSSLSGPIDSLSVAPDDKLIYRAEMTWKFGFFNIITIARI